MARFRQIVGLGAAVTPGRPVCTTAIGAMAEAAIRGLVGLDERVFGVRKVLGLSSPTLIEIAPAVWNSNYLQVSNGGTLAGLLTDELTGIIGGGRAGTSRILNSLDAFRDVHSAVPLLAAGG